MTTVPEVSSDVTVELVDRLLLRADELTDILVAQILSGDHAYAEATRLTHQDLRQATYDNLVTLLGQLGGRSRPRLDAARAAGRLKAEQQVPLAALLHAYRLAGRLIWDRLLGEMGGELSESLAHKGSELWSIIDDYSSAAAEAYGEVAFERAHRDAQARSLALRSLLSAVDDGAPLWETLRMLNLPETGTFLVVSAEIVEPVAAPLRGVEQRLRSIGVQSIWTVEFDTHIGLISLKSSATRAEADAVLAGLATGRVGVSRPFDDPRRAHDALHEAKLACRCARPGDIEVNSFGDKPIPLLIAHLPEVSRRLAAGILGPVLELPAMERDTLLETLEAWFAAGGVVADAAKRLHFHRNTVHQRLRRIEALTGRSCTDPTAAAEFYFAVQTTQLVRPRQAGPDEPVAATRR
jgi:hypothetical protein